jgi:hypothetical protein
MSVNARSACFGEPKPPEVRGDVRQDELQAAIIARSARRNRRNVPGSASDHVDTTRLLGKLTEELAGRGVAPSRSRSRLVARHGGRGAR